MGRWKAPEKRPSPYITPAGYSDLEAELRDIWRRRTGVVEALAAAAAEGDRSENAEYHYRKKQLRELDRRIRYLQKRLPELKVVREVGSAEQVFFGATVRLRRADSSEVEYRIVGPDEFDRADSYISLDSPMARALLKKRVGDEFDLQVGEQSHWFEIVDISYQQDL